MQLETGMIVNGKISGITSFGAFVDLDGGKSGMVHISEVASSYVSDINEHLKIGQEVKVKVMSIDENGKISLSIKKAEPKPVKKFAKPEHKPSSASPVGYEWTPQKKEHTDFEDMMSRFKQSSDERMAGLKKNDGFQRKSRRGVKPGK